MTREIKTIEDLELFLNQNKIFDLLGVDQVGVFGSFARGEIANDIDLLLEHVPNNNQLIDIKDELEKKTGKKIDMVLDQYANPIILHRAKKDIVYVKKYKE